MRSRTPWVFVLVAVCVATGFLVVHAFPSQPQKPVEPRPIAAQDTVFIEEMTWMEVRDALKEKKTTVIIPTGGVEENGPYVVTGKHNYILRATTDAIARKLGDALVAPSSRSFPRGQLIRQPDTWSTPAQSVSRKTRSDDCSGTFRPVSAPTGSAKSCLLGDSGGNQKGDEGGCDGVEQEVGGWQDESALHPRILRPRGRSIRLVC